MIHWTIFSIKKLCTNIVILDACKMVHTFSYYKFEIKELSIKTFKPIPVLFYSYLPTFADQFPGQGKWGPIGQRLRGWESVGLHQPKRRMDCKWSDKMNSKFFSLFFTRINHWYYDKKRHKNCVNHWHRHRTWGAGRTGAPPPSSTKSKNSAKAQTARPVSDSYHFPLF